MTRCCTRSFAGSAATGAGVPELMAGIATLLPGVLCRLDGRAVGAGVQGRARRGRREGRLRPDVLRLGAAPPAPRPCGRTHRQGRRDPGLRGRPVGPRRRGRAGQIGRLHGLAAVRVGDGFGAPVAPRSTTSHRRPSRRRWRPFDPALGPALRAALAQLADQDPLIAARTDEDGPPDRVAVRPGAAGGARLDAGRGVRDRGGVRRRERAARRAPARRRRGGHRLNTDANPYQATIGLRIEPGRSRARG